MGGVGVGTGLEPVKHCFSWQGGGQVGAVRAVWAVRKTFLFMVDDRWAWTGAFSWQGGAVRAVWAVRAAGARKTLLFMAGALRAVWAVEGGVGSPCFSWQGRPHCPHRPHRPHRSHLPPPAPLP